MLRRLISRFLPTTTSASTARASPAARSQADLEAIFAELEGRTPLPAAALEKLELEVEEITAEAADFDELFAIAGALFAGEGVTRDMDKAARLWAHAAGQGHQDSQYSLAMTHYTGFGAGDAGRDVPKAAELLERLAEEDHPLAQAGLARIYAAGEDGVRQDVDRAIALYTDSASNGFTAAHFALGKLVQDGAGGKRRPDATAAARHFREAAKRGHPASLLELSTLHCNGDGVRQDWTKGFKLCKVAAESGMPQAQWTLGNHFYFGQGTAQSFKHAREWYQLAAEQGFAYAQINLGTMYRDGQGVDADKAAAREWYVKSAPHSDTAQQLLDALDKEEEERRA